MSIPKGKLIAIGGNIDKGSESESIYKQNNNIHYSEFQILKRLLSEINKENPRIEIITTASKIPEEIGNQYLRAFKELGCFNVGLINIDSREIASKDEFIKKINESDAVLFSGGNQERLSSIFGGSQILKILQDRYLNENYVIAGTSAGAMVMSNPMIRQGSSSEALIKGEVKMTPGFAFVSNVIIDSHFVKRGRFGRLAQAIAGNPSCLGIGLGEDTGVLIENGDKLEVIGSGHIIIFDGHEIKHTNIADIQDGTPVSIENLIVHILAKGNHFDLTERKFYAELDKT